MNNNVIPTVYQAVWIEGAAKKYNHLQGELRQMKDQINLMNDEASRREEVVRLQLEAMRNEARDRERGFGREVGAAGRKGYLLGLQQAYPYTIERTFDNDPFRGELILALNQDVVADQLNTLGIKPNRLLKNKKIKSAITTANHVGKFLNDGQSTYGEINYNTRNAGPVTLSITRKLKDNNRIPPFVTIKKNILFNKITNN